MGNGTIIYIGGFELPDKNASAHRVLNNAKLIRDLGYDVAFISINKEIDINIGDVTRGTTIQGFETWYTPYPKTAFEWVIHLSSIRGFVKVLKNYNEIAAVICYDYQAMAFIKIINYCARRNIKVIGDCTEWYSLKGTNFAYKIIKGLDSFFRMRVIHKKIDGLIVISSYLRNYYKDIKNVVQIPPLVDVLEDKWQSVPVQCKKKLKLIYTGNPGINKDKLDLIIEAVCELNNDINIIFKIVGVSKDEYLKYNPNHEDLINVHLSRINFIGKVPHTESLRHIKEADFLIFIRERSRKNMAGFPTKFVESMSCSTPVITNDTSDLKNYIIHGYNGFLIKSDVKNELKEIITNYYNQQENFKANIDNKTFDYRNYYHIMNNLLSDLY